MQGFGRYQPLGAAIFLWETMAMSGQFVDLHSFAIIALNGVDFYDAEKMTGVRFS